MMSPTTRDPATETRARPTIDPQRIILFPARAFLAFGWLRAGIEKLIDREWWAGVRIGDFVSDPDLAPLPFMAGIGDWAAGSAASAVAFAVMVAEIVVGVCLLTGRKLPPALIAGIVLNVAFVLFGAVAPSAFYLVIEVTLLLATGALAFRPGRRLNAMLLFFSAATIVALARYVSTVHPAEVIEDPAIMLITLAALFGATQLLTLTNSMGRRVPGL